MKLDVEELGATKRRIKVEIPREDVETAVDQAYRELNKSVKVEGFRPGKAPRGLLEKRYGKNVEAEVLERIVPEYYVKAVKEAKITPVDDPKFDETTLKLKKGEPLSFTATVEIRPDFELAPYKGIEVRDELVEVTGSDMEEALDELREMHSTLETVEEDRPVKSGDYAMIDFEGFVDGAPIKGGKAENYPLLIGSGSMIPGFEEQVEGAVKGEAREVKVGFPGDYRNKELASKEALFKVMLKEIKKKALPKLDDEFAKDLGLGQTLGELKEKVKEDIVGIKKRALAAKQKEHIYKELARLNNFELPPSLVEKEVRSMMVRRYQEIVESGQTPQQAGFDLKDFEAQARPQAEERIKVRLVLAAIAEKEGITVSDAELEAGIRTIAAGSGYSPQEVKDLYIKKEGGLDGLREGFGSDKVLDLLLSEAKKTS